MQGKCWSEWLTAPWNDQLRLSTVGAPPTHASSCKSRSSANEAPLATSWSNVSYVPATLETVSF